MFLITYFFLLLKHCYETALFWADKLITLVDNSIRDLFTYLNCLYNCQQYQRALHLIKEKELHKVCFRFIYLLPFPGLN
jgi:anaphase-promoting complex subunit 6